MKTKKKPAKPDPILLGDDNFIRILEYCELEALWSCHRSSKALRSLITPEMAMKANLMHGGRSKLVMEQITSGLMKQRIHPPSSGRLLRLGMARNVCEICFTNRVVQLREPYCLQACWECTTSKEMSKNIRKAGPLFQSRRMETNIVLDGPRNCAKKTKWRIIGRRNEHEEVPWARSHEVRLDYIPARLGQIGPLRSRSIDSNNYLWREPFYDSSGELAGPIMTYNSALAFIDFLTTFSTTEMKEAAYERYFGMWFNVPGIDDTRYSKLVNAFSVTHDRAEREEEARNEQHRMRVRDWRREKVSKMGKLLELLGKCMNNPQNRYLLNWEENYLYVNNGIRRNINQIRDVHHGAAADVPSVVMNKEWVHEILREFIRRPSKFRTKKSLVELAKIIEFEAEKENGNERTLCMIKTGYGGGAYRYKYLTPGGRRIYSDIRGLGKSRTKRLRVSRRKFAEFRARVGFQRRR